MSDPVSHLKRELLAAAERQQGHTVLAPKSRRRWLERFRAVSGRRRRLVVVLAAVALATAVTAAGWAIVREVVLHKGFVGLPPVGATPSAPESGELVIQYWVDTDGPKGTGEARAWVYADGRLITLRRGFLEQRLTPEGVELLRSEIVSTGLEHYPACSWSLDPQRDPGADRRPASWLSTRTFLSACVSGSRIRRRGCRQARGRTARSGRTWPPGTRSSTTHGPKRSNGPASCPCYLRRPRTCFAPRTPWPSTGSWALRASRRFFRSPPTSSNLTTEEARALAQALDDAGLKRDRRLGELAYSFEIPGTSVDPPRPEKGPVRNEVFIFFWPYLPNGESICTECG